jgi:excisionase family DNA binding protein
VSELRPVPSLDALAALPELASSLPRDVVLTLHARAVRVVLALEGPLLAAAAENGKSPDVRPPGPYLSGSEAADYLRIKKSRLDSLRREGRVPATKLGKAFSYRRTDLESLRERL